MTLFGTPTRERPSLMDDIVIYAAIDAIIEKVMNWISDCNGEHVDQNEIRKELYDACSNNNDGYSAAKYLDDHNMWYCDSELVEILDNFYHHQYIELEREECRWVEEDDIKPQFSVGDIVKYKRGSHQVPETRVGEIVQIYPNGKYGIFDEAAGHVRKGVGIHCTILPFEGVEANEG